MSYFKPFPLVAYRFGNEDAFAKFQNLSSYVDIIDTIKDDVNFYQQYTILDGDRPDHVAWKIYGNEKLYWTLFLLNDNIRGRGWPLSDREVREKAKVFYPNVTLSTNEVINNRFTVGSVVNGFSSGATGTVLRRRLELGQLIVQTSGTFEDGEVITTPGVDDTLQSIVLTTVVNQYDSVHNYQDADGNSVDIDPYTPGSAALFTPVTYTERLLAQNDELREIKVLKKTTINQVVSAFTQAMRS